MSKYNQTDVAFNILGLNVDKEDGVIQKVLLARVGKINGHGMFADETFTNQIVEKGQEFSKGMKARFGHPNMSSPTLGKFIGRWKNFQSDGGNAYADLHLDQITKKTNVEGRGISMWEYILTMASDNPDMFGNSIAFSQAKPEIKTSEIENSEIDNKFDTILQQNETTILVSRVFARIKTLSASDLVDSPAATESLFSSFNTDKDFAYHATTFLDSNPEIFKLLNEHPNVLEGFMEKYNDYKTKKTNMSEEKTEFSTEELTSFGKLAAKVSTFLSGKTEIPKVETTPSAEDIVSVELSEANANVEKLTKELSEAKGSNVELSATIEDNKVTLEGLQTQFDEQKAELAKFTTTPAGAGATVDPIIDETKLSERDIEANKVAEAMKNK